MNKKTASDNIFFVIVTVFSEVLPFAYVPGGNSVSGACRWDNLPAP